MASFLHPCPHCQRHIRTDETSCPFCEASVAGAFDRVAAPRMPTGRLSRAALLALGTVVASVPLTACAGDDDQGENTAAGGSMSAGTGGASATGGDSAVNSGGDSAMNSGGDSAMNSGGDSSVAVYGVPADGGTNQGTGGDTAGGEGTGGYEGGGGPVYGIAPVDTGGTDGGIGPVYGIAPDGGAPTR